SHKEGVTLFDYNDMKIPCIFIRRERFDEIAKACYGKPLVVDTNLNILHDNRKNVFVEITLNFSSAGLQEKILLYANDNLQFFEHMAHSGMVALAPTTGGDATMNIFMVQLPKKDAIEDALEIINSYLK
ncbi:MAG: hypothetical protein QXW73_06230, partial [Nitrososphaerales archaeon]